MRVVRSGFAAAGRQDQRVLIGQRDAASCPDEVFEGSDKRGNYISLPQP